jgi:signal transduction histidine kinase
VLRHNLRNDMDAVRGYATAIETAAETDRLREHAGRIREMADGLLELSGKARSTEAVLRDDQRATETVETVLDGVTATARERLPLDGGSLTAECAPGAAERAVEAGAFRLVLRELVENAVEHGGPDPAVEVVARPADGPATGDAAGEGDGRATAATAGDADGTAGAGAGPEGTAGECALLVEVRDDGPGVPDRALQPFRDGGETQFEHNHGLGLWLVNWGVRRLNGGVEFERPETGGTVVRIRLPGHGDR